LARLQRDKPGDKRRTIGIHQFKPVRRADGKAGSAAGTQRLIDQNVSLAAPTKPEPDRAGLAFITTAAAGDALRLDAGGGHARKLCWRSADRSMIPTLNRPEGSE